MDATTPSQPTHGEVASVERNVVLTGFMGTGKSTVGRLLADLLGFRFVDTDRLIERRHGPISEIFERSGEARFRTIERSLAVELAGRRRHVMSTGGRMLLDADNAAALGATGRIFCLTAEPDTIAARIVRASTGRERPLLAGPDPHQRIAELLAERQAAYRVFEQVATDDRSPADIAADIAARLSPI